MSAVVGVDLGTTGTRAVLFRPDGTVLAEGARETPLLREGPGRVRQDPEDFVAAALDAIAQCVDRAGVEPGDVAAVGVSGQMAGVLGMAADGRASTPYDSWLDLRCAGELAALERDHADLLVRVSGCPPMVNHAPKLMWWRRHRREAFEATEKWLTPGGYVAARIAGLGPDEAFMDWTYMHFTGLADGGAGTWSPQLAEALGVPDRQLPRIVDPASVVGGLTAEAARRCGLLAGTPFAAGLGDTAASTLGAGVVRAGQLLDVAGTASILAVSTDRFTPDERSRTLIAMRGAIPGQWVSLAYFSGGEVLPWLVDLLGGSLDALVTEAAAVDAGAGGLLFVPHLEGRLLPSDPTMRGAWVGLRHDHGRAELVRSALESVAYEYAGYLRAVLALQPGFAPDVVRVVGGGSRSEVWNRIKASVLGLPLERPGRAELACWGAALVAAGAVGLVDDLAGAAEEAAAIGGRWEPDPADHAVYEAHEPVYREVLAATSAAGRRLAALEPDGEGVPV